jgi:hypothetical protein
MKLSNSSRSSFKYTQRKPQYYLETKTIEKHTSLVESRLLMLKSIQLMTRRDNLYRLAAQMSTLRLLEHYLSSHAELLVYLLVKTPAVHFCFLEVPPIE